MTLKETGINSSDYRLDSEFYTGKFARYCRLVMKNEWTTFSKEAKKAVKGAFDVTADLFVASGIPFVKISNLRDMQIDTSELSFIDEKTHTSYLASESKHGDILLSKTAYPAASIVTLEKCNSSQDTIAISLKSDSPLNSNFAVVYLNTKYGLFLMESLFTGNIQKHFNLSDCKTRLPIPLFSHRFQKKVGECFERALGCANDAKALYHSAESLLLSELGFDGWTPTEAATSVKSLSVVQSAGRFDAEYFQPKYDEIENRIQSYCGGFITAKSILIQGLVSEDAATPERYVELSDIGANGEILCCTEAAFGDLPSRARQRMTVGDVIASSVEGSLDSCALVRQEYDNALCSTGFHRFRSSDINAETVLLLFKSWPVKTLMKRGCSGTILCGISPNELSHIPLPVIENSIQRKIAELVRESFALRAESKRLLERAKKAVETAIEHGESAVAWDE